MLSRNLKGRKSTASWSWGKLSRSSHVLNSFHSLSPSSEATDVEQEVRIKFIDEIFKIESREVAVGGRGEEGEEEEGETRKKKPDCTYCNVSPP